MLKKREYVTIVFLCLLLYGSIILAHTYYTEVTSFGGTHNFTQLTGDGNLSKLNDSIFIPDFVNRSDTTLIYDLSRSGFNFELQDRYHLYNSTDVDMENSGLITGVFGDAIRLDGIRNSWNTTDSFLQTGDYILAALWFRNDFISLDRTQVLLSSGVFGVPQYRAETREQRTVYSLAFINGVQDTLTFTIGDNNTTLRNLSIEYSPDVFERNRWYHIAIRYFTTTQNQSIFINGVMNSSQILPGGTLMGLNEGRLSVGGQVNNGTIVDNNNPTPITVSSDFNYNGSIDELIIHNSEINETHPDEIARINNTNELMEYMVNNDVYRWEFNYSSFILSNGYYLMNSTANNIPIPLIPNRYNRPAHNQTINGYIFEEFRKTNMSFRTEDINYNETSISFSFELKNERGGRTPLVVMSFIPNRDGNQARHQMLEVLTDISGTIVNLSLYASPLTNSVPTRRFMRQVEQNVPYNVVVLRNQSSGSNFLYVDGINITTLNPAAANGIDDSIRHGIYIGYVRNSITARQEYANATISELQIFNRILTEEEILRLNNSDWNPWIYHPSGDYVSTVHTSPQPDSDGANRTTYWRNVTISGDNFNLSIEARVGNEGNVSEGGYNSASNTTLFNYNFTYPGLTGDAIQIRFSSVNETNRSFQITSYNVSAATVEEFKPRGFHQYQIRDNLRPGNNYDIPMYYMVGWNASSQLSNQNYSSNVTVNGIFRYNVFRDFDGALASNVTNGEGLRFTTHQLLRSECFLYRADINMTERLQVLPVNGSCSNNICRMTMEVNNTLGYKITNFTITIDNTSLANWGDRLNVNFSWINTTPQNITASMFSLSNTTCQRDNLFGDGVGVVHINSTSNITLINSSNATAVINNEIFNGNQTNVTITINDTGLTAEGLSIGSEFRMIITYGTSGTSDTQTQAGSGGGQGVESTPIITESECISNNRVIENEIIKIGSIKEGIFEASNSCQKEINITADCFGIGCQFISFNEELLFGKNSTIEINYNISTLYSNEPINTSKLYEAYILGIGIYKPLNLYFYQDKAIRKIPKIPVVLLFVALILIAVVSWKGVKDA